MRGQAQRSRSAEAKAEAEPEVQCVDPVGSRGNPLKCGFRQLATRVPRTNTWEALRYKVSRGLDTRPEV